MVAWPEVEDTRAADARRVARCHVCSGRVRPLAGPSVRAAGRLCYKTSDRTPWPRRRLAALVDASTRLDTPLAAGAPRAGYRRRRRRRPRGAEASGRRAPRRARRRPWPSRRCVEPASGERVALHPPARRRPTSGRPAPWSGCPTCTPPSRTAEQQHAAGDDPAALRAAGLARRAGRPPRRHACGHRRSPRRWRATRPRRADRRGPWRQVATAWRTPTTALRQRPSTSPPAACERVGRGLPRLLARRTARGRRPGPRRGSHARRGCWR